VYVLMKRRMPLICVKNDRKLKEKKKKNSVWNIFCR